LRQIRDWAHPDTGSRYPFDWLAIKSLARGFYANSGTRKTSPNPITGLLAQKQQAGCQGQSQQNLNQRRHSQGRCRANTPLLTGLTRNNLKQSNYRLLAMNFTWICCMDLLENCLSSI